MHRGLKLRFNYSSFKKKKKKTGTKPLDREKRQVKKKKLILYSVKAISEVQNVKEYKTKQKIDSQNNISKQ